MSYPFKQQGSIHQGSSLFRAIYRSAVDPSESWSIKPQPRLADQEWHSGPEDTNQQPDSSATAAVPWPPMPWELHGFLRAVFSSRNLIELEDDWDGEGATAIQETHWNRVIWFLTTHALWLWKTHGKKLLVPSILPGPAGSIDVHWENPQVELLIKIPADENEPATYYGDNFKKDSIEGKLDLSHENHWLVLWLMMGK